MIVYVKNIRFWELIKEVVFKMLKLIFKKLPIGMLKVEVNKNKNNKLKIGLNEILR